MFNAEDRNDLYKANDVSDDRLIRIERSWHKRAQVKVDSQKPEILIDLARPDFLEELLPFCEDETYKKYPAQLKLMLLSAGWVVYNQKTIAIETEIICPACIDLLRGGPLLSYASAATVSETLADEAFHTLFSINMCEISVSQRGIDISWPKLELSRHLEQAQRELPEADFKIYRLAFALVSETFISDYLAVLSESQEIQPIFRQAVALHKKDEAVHKNIFPLFACKLIEELSERQRLIFIKGAGAAISTFPMREVHAWNLILPQILRAYGDPSLVPPLVLPKTGAADYSAMPEVLESVGIPPPAYIAELLMNQEFATAR